MRRLRLQVLQRRQYSVSGSNSLWHIDGNHKLIRWRFVVHGGVDGFSRLVVYLTVAGNNRSSTVLDSFSHATEQYGVPSRVRSDKGGENIGVAEFMIRTRLPDRNSHITGRSVHNQRIEQMWRDVYQFALDLFHGVFTSMEYQGTLNPDNEVHLFALLDSFRNTWNCHGLRTERNQSPQQLWSRYRQQGPLQDATEVHEDYGIDWNGPHSNQQRVAVPEIQLARELSNQEIDLLPEDTVVCRNVQTLARLVTSLDTSQRKAGSTNNLHRHLRTVHPSVQWEEKMHTVETGINESATVSTAAAAAAAAPALSTASCSTQKQPPKHTTQSSMRQFLPKPMTTAKQTTTDEELAKMIALDFQPFSIVDDRGFNKFVYALNPMYALPSRKTLCQKMIPDLYHRQQESLQERVKKATSVCLTTDSWTSRTTTSFLSVTCHFIENYKMVSCLLDCFEFSDRHTSENLAEELLKVAKEWNVENKVVCCVTDNAANITKAIKILKWIHHPCLAHTINLVVKDALKVIKADVDKVKAIVEFFHRSTTATHKLKSTQQQMGIPELKLKQECITRWNSTFHMLKRILESKDAVISTLAVISAPVDPLSQEEWEVLQEACIVLEPFEQVTVEISAER
ncbi:hypothetical protein WMY93_029815 [Mugilogobius chulae]|uniref:Integrase catalytic domain-containing protein n=1 Tax=Mugilogobius chulae TaxID=88201 RepID=A0AAW0MXP9_9GOBI